MGFPILGNSHVYILNTADPQAAQNDPSHRVSEDDGPSCNLGSVVLGLWLQAEKLEAVCSFINTFRREYSDFFENDFVCRDPCGPGTWSHGLSVTISIQGSGF